jgi:glycosyltransferase involved in cell wall biosynthesis
VRVAYVNHTGKIGGAEISLSLLLEHIDKTNIAPVVVCPEGPLVERARGLGAETVTVDLGQMGFARRGTQAVGYAIGVLRSARTLSRQLRSIRPDIVHANTLRAGVIAGVARSVFGSPGKLVVHVRDCPPPGFQTRLALRLAGGPADCVIAISGYVRDHLARIGFPSDRTRMIWDAVDTQVFDSAVASGHTVLEELGLRGCYPVVSTIAQITPWKGQLEVVEAFARTAGGFPDARLLIVGEPKFTGAEARYDIAGYQRKLQDTVRDLGLADKVRFTGERNDIPSVIAASDIVVHASWEEPFGLIVVEAMSMGKPVVATRAGAMPELINNGESGLLVTPQDPASIAEAVNSLASDRALCARLGGKAAVETRNRFDIARAVSEITDLYRKLA